MCARPVSEPEGPAPSAGGHSVSSGPMGPLLLALVSLLGSDPLHPNSQSRSVTVVGADALVVSLRCQAESVWEVLPADPDGNGLVEEDELAAIRDDLAAYLLEHWQVRLEAGGDPLPGRVTELSLVTHDLDALFFSQFVEATIAYDVEAPPDQVELSMSLFLTTSPRHQDLCALVWPDGQREEGRLWGGRPRQMFVSPAPPPDVGPVAQGRRGFLRFFASWEHVAFVLALLVACGRLRAFLAVVLVFALAHSGGLALAHEGVADLPPVAVTLALGGSVLFVGILNVLRRRPRPLWIEAAIFGLVHGWAFGVAPAPFPRFGPESVTDLLAFNVGLELALLATAAGGLLLLRPLPRREPLAGKRDTSLVPGYARDVVSLSAAVMGTYGIVRQLVG